MDASKQKIHPPDLLGYDEDVDDEMCQRLGDDDEIPEALETEYTGVHDTGVSALVSANQGEDPDPTKSKKRKRDPVATCQNCSRPFHTQEGYKKHLKMHLFGELLRSGSSLHRVTEECAQEFPPILQEFVLGRDDFGINPEVVRIAEHLLNSAESALAFVKCVVEEVWDCLPVRAFMSVDTFHSLFLAATDSHFNTYVRLLVINCLKENVPFDCSEESLFYFSGLMYLKISKKVEVVVFRCLREPYESLFNTITDSKRDDVNDINFQQSVHYVSGSAVHSVLKQAERATKSPQWINVASCIQKSILQNCAEDGPGHFISMWTECQNRGGLKFIKGCVFVFFMALTQILKKVEEPDGSVRHINVFQAIMEDDPINLLWDEVINQGGEGEVVVSEEDSMFLRDELVTRFTNTWGVGVANRRSNEIKDRNRDKIALRASLLPRKNV